VQPVASAERAWLTVPLQDPARVTDLLVDLRDAGIPLAEFGVQKPTLDEVFLAITGHGAETSADEAEKEQVPA
jgi:ABC-2 type transport system ATP-binding protein